MIPFNVLSGGALGPMWPAFYRQGLWTPAADASGGMETTADIENGDTFIRVNELKNGVAGPDLATNMFEPVRTPLPGTPGAGYGKLLRLDPAGEDVQIEIRHVDPFLSDAVAGDLVIQLETPVAGLSGTLSAGALIGMGHSPVLSVGSYNREVTFVAATHGYDDRGDPRSAAPDLDIEMFMSDNQEGPFISLGNVSALNWIAITAGPAAPEEILNQTSLKLPSLAHLKFVATQGGGDDSRTVFSLFVSRSVIL